MSASRGRQFGAFIDPERVYVLEYRREAAGVEILDHMSVARSMPEIEDAVDALTDLVLRVAHVGEPSLSAAIRGFGISYQLLTLPPAGADVLELVIDREMRRLFPDIEDPVIGFAVGGNVDRRTGMPVPTKGVPERRASAVHGETLPLEILAAAAPRHVVDVTADALTRAGIRLEHLTVVPQAMARLYREVNGSPHPSALAIMLPGSPVIGVFQGGDVRFISEPPPSDESLAGADLQTVIDQVGRARIYLRQHFRGADIEKIFVAAEPADQAHVDAVLNAALNVDVLPLAPTMGPPAAVAALGSVLNAESGTEMALYPSSNQLRAGKRHRRTSTITVAAMIACVVAVTIAALTTMFAFRSANELRAEGAAADQQIARAATALRVVEDRRENMQRVEAIRAHVADRRQLAQVLNGIRLAQPPNVGVTGATLSRAADGWGAVVTGSAAGSTGAQTLRGVDAFYRELPLRIPIASLNLDTFDYAGDSADVTGSATFKVSFKVAPDSSR